MLNTMPTQRAQKFRILRKFTAFLPLLLFTPLLSAKEPPKIEAFPELISACEPFQQFLSNNNREITKEADEAERVQWLSIAPEGSKVLAFEENSRFLCATIQAADNQPLQFYSRVLLIKPSLLIIDKVRDLTEPESLAVLSLNEGIASEDPVFELAAGDDEKSVTFTLTAGGETIRTIIAATLEEPGLGDTLRLKIGYKSPILACATVSLGNRDYTLTLPTPSLNPGKGRIEIRDAKGNEILQRRPLPAGVLPHGPEGLAMIERWDRAYRNGKRPSWDARQAAPELVRVIEEEQIVKPCRAVVLGCGSGDNAIYLARKGFDVTAIDLAPTALAIAEQKAKEAGVEVNWMLADVLNIPDIEPFDFVFDRGCYHNVRYVDARGFVESLKKITTDDTQCLILSLNRNGPPGVREKTIRDDFADAFEIDWLESQSMAGRNGENPNGSWSLMLKAKN